MADQGAEETLAERSDPDPKGRRFWQRRGRRRRRRAGYIWEGLLYGGLASFNQYKIKFDHFYIDCIFCRAIAHYL